MYIRPFDPKNIHLESLVKLEDKCNVVIVHVSLTNASFWHEMCFLYGSESYKPVIRQSNHLFMLPRIFRFSQGHWSHKPKKQLNSPAVHIITHNTNEWPETSLLKSADCSQSYRERMRERNEGIQRGREVRGWELWCGPAFCWRWWVSSWDLGTKHQTESARSVPKSQHFYPMVWQHAGLGASLGCFCIYNPSCGWKQSFIWLGLAIISSASTSLTFHRPLLDCSVLVRFVVVGGIKWINKGITLMWLKRISPIGSPIQSYEC